MLRFRVHFKPYQKKKKLGLLLPEEMKLFDIKKVRKQNNENRYVQGKNALCPSHACLRKICE